ncbi:MAG: hypothetical protein J7641_16865 [Cyanobacteria bacterium SID2]|nr:hypothetical protein [Cyanobacteria bacterium SID2]MBP0004997.1 hypothetical protein [Cyanobacteria bacterium SBC]
MSSKLKRTLQDFLPPRQFEKFMICLIYLRGGDLKKIAELCKTDKHGSHYYIQHYQKYFTSLRWKRLNILEIGIGGLKDLMKGGASLRMWKYFFSWSNIYGIDIYDKSYHEENRIKTFMGSQSDPDFLKEVARKVGKIDIVIDDDSHINEHVIKTFKA